MRIVGGRHRGRPLLAPPGEAVRPTGERAREALFDILGHAAWTGGQPVFLGAAVLDAFAGTGALGLEALSRGAASATFMESDRDAVSALRRNLAALGETERAEVMAGDATRPPRARRAATLAFLDPPYRSGAAAEALPALAAAGWLAAGAVCVVETASREAFEPPAGFAPIDERRYGAARLSFLFWRPQAG